MDGVKRPSSEFATASLVLGIMQFVQLFNTEKALLAIVFGAIALKRISANSEVGGKNRAIAGLVLGIVGVIATIVITVVFWPQMQSVMGRAGGVVPHK